MSKQALTCGCHKTMQEMREVLEVVSRGICLRQYRGERCVCYRCLADEVLAHAGVMDEQEAS